MFTKKILSMMLCVLIITSFIIITQVSAAGGTGTSSDPFIISTETELIAFRTDVNSATGPTKSGVYYKLGADITITATAWVPIGNSTAKFQGSFDGNGFVINNLTLETANTSLFGFIDTVGVIKNLGITNVKIGTTLNANAKAALVQTNYGKVSSCFATGSLANSTGWNNAGLVWDNKANAIIEDSYNAVNVGAAQVAGGIAYSNAGVVRRCYNIGAIANSGGMSSSYDINGVGGIVAANTGIIQDCYNKGTITETGTANDAVKVKRYGGIAAGNTSGTISNVYNTGSFSITANANRKVGTIFGLNNLAATSITNVFSLAFSTLPLAASGTVTTGFGSTVDDATLKASATTLGASFVSDTANLNGGYPALAWQYKNVKSIATTGIAVTVSKDSTATSSLPSTVRVIFDDDSIGRSNVSWSTVDTSTTGVKTATGTLTSVVNNTNLTVSAQVTVEDRFAAVTASGTGTAGDPYLITTMAHLKGFATEVNLGTVTTGKYFKLTNSIVLDNTTWTPISETSTNAFKGNFNGAGFSISKIYISAAANDKAFLNYLDTVATLQNLTITDSTFKQTSNSYNNIAVFVLNNKGTIRNCHSTVNVEAGHTAAASMAVTNEATGLITNCTNTGQVTVGNANAGGIASTNKGKIEKSYNTGLIRKLVGGRWGSYFGGIAAINEVGAEITDCYNMGNFKDESTVVPDITNKLKELSGGLVGIVNGGTIRNSYTVQTSISIAKTDVNRQQGTLFGFCATTATITNVYAQALSGYSLIATNNTKTDGTGTVGVATIGSEKTALELKALVPATDLSTSFIADTANLNNGYLALAWQYDKDVKNITTVVNPFSIGIGGSLSALPATVAVEFTDNTTNSAVAVVWAGVDVNTVGVYTAIGTLQGVLNSTNKTISVQVTVEDRFQSATGGGTGTIADPYKISTEAHLRGFAAEVSSGSSGAGKVFQLQNDIAMSSTNWSKIANIFNGTLDGNGQKIIGLKLIDTISNLAFMQELGASGVIKNLEIVGAEFFLNSSSVSGVSIFAIDNRGLIENCYIDSTSSIKTGNWNAAGFVQNNYGIIKNSYNAGAVESSVVAGGIAIENKAGGQITSTYNSGVIKSHAYDRTNYAVDEGAGIVVKNYGTIDNCYNSGSIIEKSPQVSVGKECTTGGLVANNFATGIIRNSYNVGGITIRETSISYFGLIAGKNTGTITNSYSVEQAGLNAVAGAIDAALIKTSAELKAPEMLTLLNASQTPVKWKADSSGMLNNDYPILSWMIEVIRDDGFKDSGNNAVMQLTASSLVKGVAFATNNTDADLDVVIGLALYDITTNKLLQISVKEYTITSGTQAQEIFADLTLQGNVSNCILKKFVWSGFNGIAPLMKLKYIN